MHFAVNTCRQFTCRYVLCPQAWADANWSGSDAKPGPLHAIIGGLGSLSLRVVEHWEYDVGGGLVDDVHYDGGSIITIVTMLVPSSDFEGAVGR